MIPISLSLKGIYSYQEKEQFINFTQLCDAGLFGIFGTVGSGKSTLLEAISFALYGETERLNKRDNRGYNMMNLKSANMLIDFIFMAGKGAMEYRFIVKGKRNSKRFDDVKFGREAFEKNGGDWKPISVDLAEEITGLSYVNFKRTIIIPQGRFQEFLQLGDKDRTKMMKELFQLQRFDLSAKTKLLEDKNQQQLLKIEGQLLQLEDFTPDKLKEIEKQLSELNSEIAENSLNLKQKEKQEAEQKALIELFDKIERTEKQYTDLAKQKPEFELLKKELEEYQECQLHFKNKIEQLKEKHKQAELLKKEVKLSEKKHQQINEQLIKLEKEFQQLKSSYDNKETLKTQAEDLATIIKIKTIEAEIEQLEGRKQKGEVTIQKTIQRLEELEKEKVQQKQEITHIKENETDISEVAKIKAWYGEKNVLVKQLGDVEVQLDEKNNKTHELSSEIEKTLLELNWEKSVKDEAILKQQFADAFSQQEEQSKQIEADLSDLKVKQELSQYAEQLNEGEACPVCGSTHHPEKMEAADLSSKARQLEKMQSTIKAEIKKLNTIEKQLGIKLNEFDLLKKTIDEFSEKKSRLNEAITLHQQGFSFKQQLSEQEVEEAFSKAEEEKAKLKKLETNLEQTDKEYTKSNLEKEKYQKALNQIENDITAQKAAHSTLLEQIQTDNFKAWAQKTDKELKNKIIELNNEFESLVKKYEKAEKEISELRPERDKLENTIEIKNKDLQIVLNELGEKEIELNQQISNSKYNSKDEIDVILKKNLDIEKENQKINQFEKQVFSLSEQLEKLTKESEGKQFDKEKFELLQDELAELKSLVEKQNKQHGAFESEIKKHKAKLQEKERLSNEYKELDNRAQNINTLKKLFTASGFVNYVSSVYLQNLVNAANQRFSVLTGQKLRLELTETNDFVIRDYLNEGKTRSVKTLSGGQTFQASLSLALALADNIQSINNTQSNFFFLDEGFGSLDKESLSVVFQSLKSLRKENRVVGVISHVEELQQEIDSYLKVENLAEDGSRIVKSWE